MGGNWPSQSSASGNNICNWDPRVEFAISGESTNLASEALANSRSTGSLPRTLQFVLICVCLLTQVLAHQVDYVGHGDARVVHGRLVVGDRLKRIVIVQFVQQPTCATNGTYRRAFESRW